METATAIAIIVVLGVAAWRADRIITALGRAAILREWRQYRRWRDDLRKAQNALDLDEADRLCRIGPRGYALEVANGGGRLPKPE